MAEKAIGRDIAPPDLHAKITGRAKYAEDFRAEGMLFAKLLLSPMPHARVRSVNARAALAMEGVVAVLRADDEMMPEINGVAAEAALTNEPLYEGEAVLAVAAETETIAAAGHRSDPRRLRASAIRRGPTRQPSTGRAQRPPRRQHPVAGRPDPRDPRVQVDQRRLRGGGPRPAPNGRAASRVEHRRRRSQLRGRGPHSRGDDPPPVAVAPSDGAPELHGVLAERQALPPQLHPKHLPYP